MKLLLAICGELNILVNFQVDSDGKNVEDDDENIFEDEEDEDSLKESSNEVTKEYEIDERSVFVYGGGGKCVEGHYNLEKVDAYVKILSRFGTIKDIKVPSNYCPLCNCYYISSLTYSNIKNQGNLLCQKMSSEEYIKFKGKVFKDDNLKSQSILNMAGYNVNSIDNYTKSYRQEVLKYVIETGLLSKKRVIGYLNYFIRLNEGRANLEDAVEKWRMDRDFLTGYEQKERRVIGVRRIIY